MAFRNPPIAGLTLVRPALQSPNYVLGSAGWSINRDGTVEFNNGTFRGSVAIGNPAAQHAILANPSTGDAVDVYNSSNQLIFSVDGSGIMSSIDPVNNIDAQIQTAGLAFHVPRGTLAGGAGGASTGTVGTTRTNSVGIFANGHGSGLSSSLTLIAGSDDGTSSPARTLLTERGVNASPLVIPNPGSAVLTNNQMWISTYVITTDAGGSSVFNHGAPFTPKEGFLVGVNGLGANFFYQYAWFATPFTSTTAKAAFKDNFGASLASTTLGAFGIFFG